MTTSHAREQLLSGIPVNERRLSLNGIATATLEGGAGPTVVLLHGPGAYGAQWRDVIADLVASHRVIVPDLPGHGESATFDGMPAEDLVDGWLDDLIECSCQSPPVLVGHTLGGAIAARFAALHGERLTALVLVDALGLTEFSPTPEFGSALNAFLSAPSPRTHDRLWQSCVFDLPAVQRQLGDAWHAIKTYNLDRALAPGRLDALRRLMEQFGVPAIPAAILARIGVPTTLIWGRRDRATPLAIAEQASMRFGWDLHVIDDAADDPALEQPAAFMAALHRALETAP